MADLVGTVLAGRFRIVRMLGTGAMGEVYLAEHTTLARRFAIKVLHESVQGDARMVERFRREARAASTLDHPNIVSIMDFGRTEEDRLYLVMEHIDGQSLQEAIDEVAPGRMPFARVSSILDQICAAVQAAHAVGVVHRDIKPDNVLLGRGMEGRDRVKILDFGLAKMMQDQMLSRLTRKGEIFGTPAYMSPEQAVGEPTDHRADIYSVGVIAYELFAGRLPFIYHSIPRLLLAHQQETPAPPSAHLPPGAAAIPAAIEAVILRCLEKDPRRRPESMAEVHAVLRATRQRLRGSEPRAAPFVVIDDSRTSHADAGSDWCEVTYDAGGVQTLAGDVQTLAGGVETLATLLSDDLIEEIPSDELEEIQEPSPDDLPHDAPRAWYWSQISKKAKALASHLLDHRLGDVDLARSMAELAECEERTLTLETEVALARSRIEELATTVREAESRLRYAVIDLSMERGRLIDEGRVSREIIGDIDFQIQTLESRISALYQEQVDKHRALEQAIQARQERLVVYQQRQVDAEARLLNQLHRLRPHPCPADLQRAYGRIEDLLRAMQRAGEAAGSACG